MNNDNVKTDKNETFKKKRFLRCSRVDLRFCGAQDKIIFYFINLFFERRTQYMSVNRVLLYYISLCCNLNIFIENYLKTK